MLSHSCLMPRVSTRLRLRCCLLWLLACCMSVKADYTEIDLDTTLIDLSIDAQYQYLSTEKIRDQVRQSARMLENYYGKFPIDALSMMFLDSDNQKLISGTVYGGERPYIIIKLARELPVGVFEKDWVIVHEMVHLAMPNLARKHYWLEEGLATYIEPFVRRDAKVVDNDYVWKWLKEGLPNAVNEPFQKGLDHTPTWAQIYWGGTLFCLMADIQIRAQSEGKFSLRNALIAISQSFEGMRDSAVIEDVLRVGDEATQTQVLSTLYASMGKRRYDIDLNRMWSSLGLIFESDGSISRDDTAEKAWIRLQLETPNPKAPAPLLQ